MKKQFFTVIAALASALIVYLPTQAQQPATTPKWTLKQCIEYAHQNHVTIKQRQVSEKLAQVQHRQNEAAKLPNANASYSHAMSLGRTIDPTSNSFAADVTQFQGGNLDLSSQYLLYNGNRRKNTIALSQLQIELAHLETQETANDLSLSVLNAYLQVVLAEEQVTILRQQAEQTQQQISRTQKLIDNGSLPAGSIASLEAQAANDQLNITTAENAVKSAYLALAQATNQYDPILVTSPVVTLPTRKQTAQRPIEELLTTAYSTYPQLKTAQMRTQIAEKSLQIAEGGKYPTVALFGSLSSNYSTLAKEITGIAYDTTDIAVNIPTLGNITLGVPSPTPTYKNKSIFNQLGDNIGGRVGLTVQVPIYNNYSIKGGIAQAKINIENTLYAKEMLRINLRNQVEQAYLNTLNAADRYEALQTSIEAAQQAYDFAEKRLAVGAGNMYDYLQAKNQVATAELNRQVAKYEYYFRLKILDFYEGKPISE